MRHTHFTVVYDACVLYPAPLRDFLVRLAVTGAFRARWTEAIHDEWVRNLLANRADLSREKLERTVALMNQAVPDCLVEGYELLIGGLICRTPMTTTYWPLQSDAAPASSSHTTSLTFQARCSTSTESKRNIQTNLLRTCSIWMPPPWWRPRKGSVRALRRRRFLLMNIWIC